MKKVGWMTLIALFSIVVCVCIYFYSQETIKKFFEHTEVPISLTTIDATFLQEIIHKLSDSFGPKIKIKSIVQLTQPGRRNVLLRIMLESQNNDVPKSVILKQAFSEEFSHDNKAFGRFARDWAGLAFLSSLKTEIQIAPRFYGGSIDHHFILLEDLGEKHVSLIDSLTFGNADLATNALRRFMRCLAELHASSYGKTGDYLKLLHGLNPEASQDDLKIFLNKNPLESPLKQLGILYEEGIKKERDMVIRAVIEPGPFTTFIHGDCCPDNTFDDQKKNELLLIDFEWGFVRSALLDATYIRMDMPNCWCAKAIPENIIESLEVSYRQELMKKIEAARDDKVYYDAYVHACAFWMLSATGMIEDVLNKDEIWPSDPMPEKSLWKPEENSVRARVLSRLQTFIDVSKKHEKLPHLRAMAEQMLKEFKIRWPGAKPMGMYPAYE